MQERTGVIILSRLDREDLTEKKKIKEQNKERKKLNKWKRATHSHVTTPKFETEFHHKFIYMWIVVPIKIPKVFGRTC